MSNTEIHFKPRKVTGEVASQSVERKLFRPALNCNFTINPEQFALLLADRLGRRGDVVFGKYVLDTIPLLIAENLNKGGEVDLGWASFSPKLKGSLASVDSKVDSSRIEVKASLSRKFRRCITDLVCINEISEGESILYTVQESGLMDLNVLKVAGADIAITGRGLLIVPSRGDEGVWLEDASRQIVARGQIVETDHLSCLVRFGALPKEGKYQLVIGMRNGEDETHAVVALKRRIEVK